VTGYDPNPFRIIAMAGRRLPPHTCPPHLPAAPAHRGTRRHRSTLLRTYR